MSFSWRVRQVFLGTATLLCVSVAVFAVSPRPDRIEAVIPDGSEPTWPLEHVTLAPLSSAPIKSGATSIHRQGERTATIEWSGPIDGANTNGRISRHVVVMEHIPSRSPLAERGALPCILWILGLSALVLALWHFNRARGFLLPNVAIKAPGSPYRTPDELAGHVDPWEVEEAARVARLEHHSRRLTLATATAVVVFLSSGALFFARPSAPAEPPVVTRPMPEAVFDALAKRSEPGAFFDIGVKAPLPVCDGTVFYESVAIHPANKGWQDVAIRETLVNTAGTPCDVPDATVTFDGVDRGRYDGEHLAPFETRVRVVHLHGKFHARRIDILRAPNALTLDLWQGKHVATEAFAPSGPPLPLVPFDHGAPVLTGPFAWSRFRVSERYPGVTAFVRNGQSCVQLSDLVIDDAFIGKEIGSKGRSWIFVDVAFLRSQPVNRQEACDVSRPYVFVRGSDNRRVADAWHTHAPFAGARDSHQWALAPGTDRIELSFGWTNDNVLELDVLKAKANVVRRGEGESVGTANADFRSEWEKRDTNRKAYIAKRELRSWSWDPPSRLLIERDPNPVRLLCSQTQRFSDRSGPENAPTTALFDEVCGP